MPLPHLRCNNEEPRQQPREAVAPPWALLQLPCGGPRLALQTRCGRTTPSRETSPSRAHLRSSSCCRSNNRTTPWPSTPRMEAASAVPPALSPAPAAAAARETRGCGAMPARSGPAAIREVQRSVQRDPLDSHAPARRMLSFFICSFLARLHHRHVLRFPRPRPAMDTTAVSIRTPTRSAILTPCGSAAAVKRKKGSSAIFVPQAVCARRVQMHRRQRRVSTRCVPTRTSTI